MEGSKTTLGGLEGRWKRSIPKHVPNQAAPLKEEFRFPLGLLRTTHAKNNDNLSGWVRHKMQKVSFCGLPFHSLDSILWCTKVFNFDKVQFIYGFFYCLCFGCHIQEIIAKSMWRMLSPVFSSESFTVLSLWSIMN